VSSEEKRWTLVRREAEPGRKAGRWRVDYDSERLWGFEYEVVVPASEVERLKGALGAGLRLANVVHDLLVDPAIATGDLDAKQEAETLMGLALGAFRKALEDAGLNPYARDAAALADEAKK
jgi:hypothetical protein